MSKSILFSSSASFLSIAVFAWLSMTNVTSAEPQHHDSQHHQHKGHHDFKDTNKWIQKFEEPARAEWQKPDLVVKTMKLKPGNNVADIGAASGYFTRRMAKAVSPGGIALAVELEPGFFSYILDRARKEGQFNLFTVKCSEDDPNLPEKTLDVIFICDTLHHIEKREAYYQKLRKALRADGRVVIVDFKKYADIPVGPKPEMRLSSKKVQAEFEAAGFAVEVDIDTLPYQYILTARKI